MKNRSVNILIVSFILIGVFAIMLIFFVERAKETFPDNITVSSEGTTDSLIPIRNLRLSPTESKEYSVNLVCEASGSFYITLSFEELADGGMKEFINVTVRADGELLYEGTLIELLDGDVTIDFEGELHATEPLAVSITYEMPREVGNEAQGTYSDFNLHVAVEKS